MGHQFKNLLHFSALDYVYLQDDWSIYKKIVLTFFLEIVKYERFQFHRGHIHYILAVDHLITSGSG